VTDLRFELKPFQAQFVYSQARHPAFVGGWSTAKTLCGISRALLYTKGIPNNLGVVFRKEFTDLRDSTIQDFKRYTGLVPNSQRDIVYPNGSTIMFRHIEELNNIQNINLGWFFIEQAEELDSANEFFMLFGRLRRQMTPDPEFAGLHLPDRSGWVVGNAADNWLKELWKDGKLEASQTQTGYSGVFSELYEATTWDNADVLPKDFLESLKVLEVTNPTLYRQYVLNDWSVTADQYLLIPPTLLAQLKAVKQYPKVTKRLVVCDPSLGGDECVLYALENTRIVGEQFLHERDPMKIAGFMQVLANRHGTTNYAVDSTGGLGEAIAARIREVQRTAYVQSVNMAESSGDETKRNLRAEIYWFAMTEIQERRVVYPEDEELRRQLTSLRFKPINSSGVIQMEPKDQVRKRLKRSPDRADAYVMGLWALARTEPVAHHDAWADDTKPHWVGSQTTSAMTA